MEGRSWCVYTTNLTLSREQTSPLFLEQEFPHTASLVSPFLPQPHTFLTIPSHPGLWTEQEPQLQPLPAKAP